MVRSRGGCRNCRRRKKKCDEARPECQACQGRGFRCEGYDVGVRWANGIASRGRFAGARTPAQPTGEQDSARENSSSLSFEDSAALDQILGVDWSLPISFTSPPSVTTSSTGESPDQQSHDASPAQRQSTQHDLFAKFLRSGFRRLHATRAENYLQTFFESMSEDSDALVFIGAAIQAYLDNGLSVSSMEFVDQALQTFRSELAYRHDPMVAATTCAGLLICTLYLLQAKPWTKYLQLMANLYRLNMGITHVHPSPEHDMPNRHALEVMAIMDMPTFVIGRLSPSVGLWKRLRQAQHTWRNGLLNGIEDVSGLPRTLLDIFAHINDDGDRQVENDFWAWPGDVGETLQCHLWESWRFAGILTIRRRWRVSGRIPDNQGSDSPKSPEAVQARAASDEVVLCRLLASMDAVILGLGRPENGHTLVFNGLRYPLVAASLEVPLLHRHAEWKALVDRVRSFLLEVGAVPVGRHLCELFDEAWEAGRNDYDIEAAVRKRDLELAVF